MLVELGLVEQRYAAVLEVLNGAASVSAVARADPTTDAHHDLVIASSVRVWCRCRGGRRFIGVWCVIG